MNEQKIELLKEKRLKLQEEIRLKNLRERVAFEIAHLEKTGESYAVHYDFEHLNWIDSNVSVRKKDGYNGIWEDFQIDVDDSTASSLIKLREGDINGELFKKHVQSLLSEDNTLIVCYQGGDPEIEISVRAFLNQPSVFLNRMEAWLLTTDKKWIIEYIADQDAIRFIQLKGSVPTLVKKILIE
jgi:hypothetical protein